jgi:hypothetical protein
MTSSHPHDCHISTSESPESLRRRGTPVSYRDLKDAPGERGVVVARGQRLTTWSSPINAQ